MARIMGPPEEKNLGMVSHGHSTVHLKFCKSQPR
jgi:hypothetical protein